MIGVFENCLRFLLEPNNPVVTYHLYSDYIVRLLMEHCENIYKQYKQDWYTCKMNINDNSKLDSITCGDSYLPAVTIISADKKYRVEIYLFDGEIDPDYRYMNHYVLDDTYIRFKKDNETRILHISPAFKVEYKYKGDVRLSMMGLDD